MTDGGNRFAKAHAAAVADLRTRQADALVELRKREILDTASRLFASKGYHQTAIADIAKALQIGHWTVYRYFENKRDILDQVIDDLASRFLATAVLGNAPDAATTLAEYRAQVHHFATAFWGLSDTEPAIRMLLHQADSVDPELAERADDFIHSAALLVSGYLENGKQRGFVRADLDAQATAEAVIAIVVGTMVGHRGDDTAARERYTAAAVSLMFDGVSAKD
jgi:AcrR family transcriptional regulator